MGRRDALLVLAISVCVFTACGDDPTASQSSGGATAHNATAAALLPTRVAALPDMNLDGYRELVTQLKGTPVVVNFWASWCGPCKAEAPLLRAASRAYGDRVQFLGVDILDSRSGAVDFITRERVPYPSVFDPAGDIRDALGLIGQPATVFYGADGDVAKTWDGQLSRRALDQGIKQITT